jgi:hypothetical protein
MQLAHAASPKLHQEWVKKKIPVFFCGILRAALNAQRAAWVTHGERVAGQLNAIAEEFLAADGFSLVECVKQVLAVVVNCSDPFKLHLYYLTVDAFLRDFHRVETLKQMNRCL